MKEVCYQVWFEGERAKRSRSFDDEEAAHAWARANQPSRRYELSRMPSRGPGGLFARLRRKR